MTKTTTLAALLAAGASLAACGGSGDAGPPPPPPPQPQTFSYAPPPLGTSDTWTRTLTDSVGTSVLLQLRQRVTQANADGSEAWTYDDPTAVDEIHDGVTFRTTPQVDDIAANGNTVDYTNTHVDGTQVTCTYGQPTTGTAIANAGRVTALAARRGESFSIGQSWTNSYSISCAGQATVNYQAVVDVPGYETVTVPAGTFQAVKQTVHLTWVDNGVAGTSDMTLWRDPAHWMFPVKSDQAIARSGATTAYITRDQRELASRQ